MDKKMINIISSNSNESSNFFENLRKRAENFNGDISKIVEDIVNDIRINGDEALIKYTTKFDSDKISTKNMLVSSLEIEEAYKSVDNEFIDALKTAEENIREFHEKQKRNSWMMTQKNGVVSGQIITGLEKVGIYVPGGSASYPSSVLMNTIPAKVAGVENIIMATPPSKSGKINPYVLVAADIAGVNKIYKVGGAQAIAALAFGTKTVEKVDKIVGPGNIYVALAKRFVFGYVDIDMIAGPSEILIIADDSCNPKFIAADLMSQAEHDALASAILLTDSVDIAQKVQQELTKQIKELSRYDIIEASLKNYGAIIVTQSIEESMIVANEIAPEHLELCVKEPFTWLPKVKNAGSIFLGSYSPEPLGDYIAGPNHVLPTNGTARFFSPLSVDTFIKKSSFLSCDKSSLIKLKDKITKLAESEGLTAHAKAIRIRFE
jgi:histidinol dehydrogenase